MSEVWCFLQAFILNTPIKPTEQPPLGLHLGCAYIKFLSDTNIRYFYNLKSDTIYWYWYRYIRYDIVWNDILGKKAKVKTQRCNSFIMPILLPTIDHCNMFINNNTTMLRHTVVFNHATTYCCIQPCYDILLYSTMPADVESVIQYPISSTLKIPNTW